MRCLVVYYSRTGITKTIGDLIAKRIDADVEEIIDLKSRSGVLGYITGGRDAFRRTMTEVKKPKLQPANYDLVVIGSPTWAGTMAPAIRTFVYDNAEEFKQVAFFCTRGSAKEQDVFKHMEELIDMVPKAKVGFSTKEVKADDFDEKLDEFIHNLFK